MRQAVPDFLKDFLMRTEKGITLQDRVSVVERALIDVLLRLKAVEGDIATLEEERAADDG